MADSQYDVSPEQKRAVLERAKMRQVLKKEYQKQISNPYRHMTNEGGTLFDPGVQRFMSMRATLYDHFKPTPKSSAIGFLLIVLPVGLYGWIIRTQRAHQENKYRTGQVAYKDRNFKFI